MDLLDWESKLSEAVDNSRTYSRCVYSDGFRLGHGNFLGDPTHRCHQVRRPPQHEALNLSAPRHGDAVLISRNRACHIDAYRNGAILDRRPAHRMLQERKPEQLAVTRICELSLDPTLVQW